jgi:hypothetical protein
VKKKTARPVAVPPPAPESPSFRILGPDDTDELNPRIIDEIEPGMRGALYTASCRLGEYQAETVRRLLGLALWVAGLDPASQDEAVDALPKLLGEDEDANDFIHRLCEMAGESQHLSIERERLDRVEFLKARQAELKRLRGESRERFEREIGAPVRARLAAGA